MKRSKGFRKRQRKTKSDACFERFPLTRGISDKKALKLAILFDFFIFINYGDSRKLAITTFWTGLMQELSVKS
jgi:hypothetical protein